MQDRHSCKRRLGCLFCLCRRRIWQGGADVSGETKEMIKIIKMCSMLANVFLVPSLSYLLGSKGNMHQLPTGLPDVFTVLRLGVNIILISRGCKNHILRLDHSREADLCNLLLKLRPNVFIYFAKGKRTLWILTRFQNCWVTVFGWTSPTTQSKGMNTHIV